MDQHRIVAVTRILSSIPTRREVLRGLAAAGLGLGTARLPEIAVAKKKRKRKPKPPKPNAYGCLNVGATCKSAEQCCTALCEGKKCRAHGTGTCRQDLRGVCLATLDDAALHYCNNSASCGCHITTAGSRYCTDFLYTQGDPRCADCQKDADCLALGFPAGSACAPVGYGLCSGRCPTGMACLVPCGTELPTP